MGAAIIGASAAIFAAVIGALLTWGLSTGLFHRIWYRFWGKYWLGVPGSINNGFVGREKELEDIARAFNDHRIVVIAGGLGFGKSRLATEYARQYENRVFWTKAEGSAELCITGLTKFLKTKRGGLDAAEVVEKVEAQIEKLPDNLLWVLDDVPNLDLINEIQSLGESKRILITTYDSRLAVTLESIAKIVHINVLQPDSAAELLCSRSQYSPEYPAIAEIANTVGYLPLALEILARELGQDYQSPDDVLARLNDSPNPIDFPAFKDATGLTISQPESLYATLINSLDELPGEVRDWLAPLGYVSPDVPITNEFLTSIVPLDADTQRLRTECYRRSIIYWDDAQRSVNALTAAAISATNQSSAISETLDRASARIHINAEFEYQALPTEIAHHEQFLFHAVGALGPTNKKVYEYADSLARTCRDKGLQVDAADIQQTVVECLEMKLGSDHTDTMAGRKTLAGDYWAANDHTEAIRTYHAVLIVQEDALGHDHAETLNTRKWLAHSYRTIGDFRMALTINQSIVDSLERVLGLEHPDTLSTRHNLAADYTNLGKHQEALELDEKTLEARERVLGPEHPDTLSSRHNLAADYFNVGRHQEAIELMQSNINSLERVLGHDHPRAVAARETLARWYTNPGPLFPASFDPYYDILKNQGFEFDASGEYVTGGQGTVSGHGGRAAQESDTIRRLKEVLAMQERELSRDDPGTLITRDKLAAEYLESGNFNEAIRLYRENLSRRQKVLVPDHPDIAENRKSLKHAYHVAGRPQEADAI